MSYQQRQYVAPPAEAMPKTLRPLIRELNELREAWKKVSDQEVAARIAAAGATRKYQQAVIDAARRGEDSSTVTDDGDELQAEGQRLALAETGVHDAVRECWWRLWSAIHQDYPAVLAHVEAPCEKSTDELVEVERKLAEVRAELGQRLGVRHWVSQRANMPSAEFIVRAGNGPKVIDADADTLAKMRAEDAQSAARDERQAAAKAKAKAISEQRQAEHDASNAKRKARRAARLA